MTLKRIVCFMFLIFAVQLSLVLCSQSTIDDHDVSETGEIENSTKGNSSNAVVQNYNIYTEDYYEVSDRSLQVAAIVYIIVGCVSMVFCFVGCCCLCCKQPTEHRGFIVGGHSQGQGLVNVHLQQSFPQQQPPAYNPQGAGQMQQFQYAPRQDQQQRSPANMEFQNALADHPPKY